MTQARRSLFALMADRATQGFYVTIVGACLAFASMVLGPTQHTEWLLTLAWVCMIGSMACLAGRLAAELALEGGT